MLSALAGAMLLAGVLPWATGAESTIRFLALPLLLAGLMVLGVTRRVWAAGRRPAPSAPPVERGCDGCVCGREGGGCAVADRPDAESVTDRADSQPVAEQAGSQPVAEQAGSQPVAGRAGTQPVAGRAGTQPVAGRAGSQAGSAAGRAAAARTPAG
jgi:hypothetical protein